LGPNALRNDEIDGGLSAKTFIGTREQFRFNQFDFETAWGVEGTRIRRTPPPGNTYKILFSQSESSAGGRTRA
jgi:hypothetical protein